MINLIKNEYIKLLKKKSTLIMTIIVLLGALGLQLLLKFSMQETLSWMSYPVSSYIEDTESSKDVLSNDEYKQRMAYANVLNDLGIESVDDWKAIAIMELQESCYTVEDGDFKYDAEKFDDYMKIFKEQGFGVCLEVLAATYEDEVYRGEDTKDFIVNPFRYLKDLGVKDLDDWRIIEVGKIIDLQQSIRDGYYEPKSDRYVDALANIEIAKYAIENDCQSYITKTSKDSIDDLSPNNIVWKVLLNTTGILTILSIMMLIIAGMTVASEYSGGTIKFLLMNPVKRGKIIISKYLMVVSLSVALTTMCYLFNVVLAAILFDGNVFGASYLSFDGETVKETSALLYLAMIYGIKFISVFVYLTMAFAISSLLKSTAVAVGIGMACMAFGSFITMLLQEFKVDFGRYLIFANTDLLSISNGMAPFSYMTLGFSITVLVVHVVVFLLAAYDGFVRREV